MVSVFLLKNDRNISKPVFNQLINILMEEDRQYVRMIKKLEQREIVCLSRILLQFILINHYNIEPNRIGVIKNKFGKPYLREYKNLFFNISHSGDMTVVAVSNNEVGVDIELIRAANIDSIIKRFHESEIKYIISHHGEDRIKAFFLVWTLKESYLKALGVGLTKELNSFSVISILKEKSNILLETEKEYENKQMVFQYKEIEGKWLLSICSVFDKIGSMRFIDSNSLIEMILS